MNEATFRAKLKNLPSACIRYKDEPVVFEMSDHCGPMNHLYTLKDHRKKGLGTALENALAQRLIEYAFRP